jgi:uncharacterized protein (TIGR03067 family)
MKGMLLVLTAGLLLAADKPAKEDTKDKEKIQGTWAAVSAVRGGEKQPEEKAKQLTLILAADGKATIKHRNKETEGKYTFDAGKKPKEFGISADDKTLEGIYKLEGDTLTLCIGEKGNDEKPTKFESKEGTKVMLIVFKRQKE